MIEDTHELIAMHEEDDGCLVMTFKNRSYFIREAGSDNTIPVGNVFIMGNSGRRRKPITLIAVPIGNAFHAIIEGALSESNHTLYLRPEDFRALKDVRYQSARKKFQVIVGGKQAR